MAQNYKRSDRVGDLIKEEIAGMILRGEIKDPRIGFVTLTHVKTSPDIKEATVYFSQIGSDVEIADSRNGLNNASGYVRRGLAKLLDLRHIPQLKFEYDDSLAYSERIGKVLNSIKKNEESE